MTRFLLIRHGETDMVGTRLSGRMPGVSLNATGQLQAQRLPLLLTQSQITAIYASPLERAIETAAPLARAKGLEVQVSAALAELDYGEWTGRSFHDLETDPAWREFNAHRSSAPVPGGESMLDVQMRAVTELSRLRDLHAGGIVAVVSHAEWIRCAVMHCLQIHLDLFFRVQISTGSVSTIELDNWSPTVWGLNLS